MSWSRLFVSVFVAGALASLSGCAVAQLDPAFVGGGGASRDASETGSAVDSATAPSDFSTGSATDLAHAASDLSSNVPVDFSTPRDQSSPPDLSSAPPDLAPTCVPTGGSCNYHNNAICCRKSCIYSSETCK